MHKAILPWLIMKSAAVFLYGFCYKKGWRGRPIWHWQMHLCACCSSAERTTLLHDRVTGKAWDNCSFGLPKIPHPIRMGENALLGPGWVWCRVEHTCIHMAGQPARQQRNCTMKFRRNAWRCCWPWPVFFSWMCVFSSSSSFAIWHRIIKWHKPRGADWARGNDDDGDNDLWMHIQVYVWMQMVQLICVFFFRDKYQITMHLKKGAQLRHQ